MATSGKKSEPKPTLEALTVRIPPAAYGELGKAAVNAGLPVAHLARALLLFGLAQLKKGDPGADRAIKVSRD